MGKMYRWPNVLVAKIPLMKVYRLSKGPVVKVPLVKGSLAKILMAIGTLAKQLLTLVKTYTIAWHSSAPACISKIERMEKKYQQQKQ